MTIVKMHVIERIQESLETTTRRTRFLVRTLRQLAGPTDPSCPYCGALSSHTEGRKFLVLRMQKCLKCGLLFRFPTDSEEFNKRFYQTSYRQKGLTTDLPSDDELKRLIATNFADTVKDFNPKINVLKSKLPTGRVLDYGCSWGYTIYQLRLAGYESYGFELSEPRAQFGQERMGLKIWHQFKDLENLADGYFDAILTSHVLEHLPSLRGVFERFHRLLKPGGILGIWVPNGGGEKAQRLGVHWGPMISEKHTLVLTPDFLSRALPEQGFTLLAVTDSDHPPRWEQSESNIQAAPPGDELLVLASRNIHS